MKKRYYILALVVFLAIFLRFYKLGQNPPSLTWDEVALGYNAYSLGIDGKDEFGRFLPYDYLESFGDFKPPVYAYLDILPVKIFGLNEFAVRFPSALFGVLAVLITYFLTKRIFWNSKSKELYGLSASLFLAISPWHINLSRAAFEANVSTFFIISGVWLFFVGIKEKKWSLILSVISFVISMYTFNTARIISPILIAVLTVFFRKELIGRKKETLIAAFTAILLILPIAHFLLSSQASLRFKEVNIFSDINVIKRTNQEVENDKNLWWSKILHNRRLAYGAEYIRHYMDNLSPSFLFIKGDGNPKFSTQDVGQMYLIELPFLILGILLLFRKREGAWLIVFSWLIISIIPAATARETPHGLRIEASLPTFQILVAYGLVSALSFIKSRLSKYQFVVYGLFFLLLLFNFLYYTHGYYSHYLREYSREWQYGYKESIDYVKSVENKYEQIRITTILGRPYIYYLFFTKTNPEIFRKNMIVQRDSFGFVTVSGFLKYRFSDDLGSIQGNTRKDLYVNIPSRVHPKGTILKDFYLLNRERVLTAYTL